MYGSSPVSGGGYKTGLTEHEGFYRCQLVAMAVEEFQRELPREYFHGFAVEPETEGAGEGDERGGFPVAGGIVDETADTLALHVKTLGAERRKPVGMVDVGQRGDGGTAGKRRPGVVNQQVAAARSLGGATHYHLRNQFTAGAVDGRVVDLHYMQYHRIVGGIGIMAMAEPVGSAHMDFHISHPGLAIDFHSGVEKVGPGIGVEYPLVHDADATAVDSGLTAAETEAVLPYELHQLLHGAW